MGVRGLKAGGSEITTSEIDQRWSNPVLTRTSKNAKIWCLNLVFSSVAETSGYTLSCHSL